VVRRAHFLDEQQIQGLNLGDPRFLDQISKCIASRRALLGIDAPTKIAPTSPDGQEPYHSHVMAQLMRLAEQSSIGPIVIDGEFIEHGTNSETAVNVVPAECPAPGDSQSFEKDAA
jgi:hypothetical protein